MTTPSGNSVGLAAVVSAVVLGIAIVAAGNNGAGDEPAANAGATAAAFEPKKFAVTTTRFRIWDKEDWSAQADVRLIAKDAAATLPIARKAAGRLATGDGRQLRVRLKNVRAPEGSTMRLMGRLTSGKIPGAGEYTGTLSLDPLDEKAASAEITLKARHYWLWPWFALLFGIGAGVLGTWLYDAYRRRSVLRIALIEAAEQLIGSPHRSDVFNIRRPLLETRAGDLTPSATECHRSSPTEMGEVPRLWCKLRGATLAETLDELQDGVEDVTRRVDVWKRAADGALLLGAALDELPPTAPTVVRSQSEQLLRDIKENEPSKADADATVQRLHGQSAVLRAFTQTWKVYVALGSPTGMNPGGLYEAAEDAATRSAEASRQLAARLREHELALQMRGPSATGDSMLFFRDEVAGRARMLVTSSGDDPILGLTATTSAYGEEARRLKRGLRIGDFSIFLGTLVVASLAFLLPVYTATNFGTLDQYFAVFAAGFLGKVAVDQGLAPIRSTRLKKPEEESKPGAELKPAESV